jgi:hypothetical protein
MEKTKVVVVVEGGMARVLVSDTDAVDVEILDLDAAEAEGTEEELEYARKIADNYDGALHEVW